MELAETPPSVQKVNKLKSITYIDNMPLFVGNHVGHKSFYCPKVGQHIHIKSPDNFLVRCIQYGRPTHNTRIVHQYFDGPHVLFGLFSGLVNLLA